MANKNRKMANGIERKCKIIGNWLIIVGNQRTSLKFCPVLLHRQTKNNKTVNRNRIIQTATALFAAYGIKGVDMKRIAKEAFVSEQALEAEFSGIEQLLEACVQHEIETLETDVTDAISQSQSSLELLIDDISTVFAERSRFCATFYKDLNAYPAAWNRVVLFKDNFRNRCIGYFRDCEKDGFFSPDFNMESTTAICVETLGNIQRKFQPNVIRVFLQSISTEKGENEINRINSERIFL